MKITDSKGLVIQTDEMLDKWAAAKQAALSSTAPVITWSPQQNDFLVWCETGKGSCVLIAVAGAGKTTVLIAGALKMAGDCIYIAYNKDVADETQLKIKKLEVDWKKLRASTVHALGLGIIRKAEPNVKVDKNKVRDIADKIIPEQLAHRAGEVLKLVSLAKQSAFGTAGPAIGDMHGWLNMAEHYDVFDDDVVDPKMHLRLIELAQAVLIENNKILEVVDFDDMVYLPPLHELPCWRFTNIVLDEAQDTNPARRALVRMILRKGGRLVAVGDPAQAIYAFQGADPDSLDRIKKEFNAIEMPLTVSFRCPQRVVKFAQTWVSHITAADSAPEGEVSQVEYEAFLQRNDLNGSAAVLCRTNKPLVALAFALLRRRVPCKIAGREDVGGSLKKLLTRWKITDLDKFENKLDDWLQKQTSRLLAKKKEDMIAALEDRVETVSVIIAACREQKKYRVQDAVDWIDSMFTDEKGLNLLLLSSIHKSKGQEWNTVFWLDRVGTCPNKWARQDWQVTQEMNLQYVAATRAKERLIDVVVAPREGGKA